MTAPSRRPLVAANWKMHLLTAEAEDWCARVRAGLGPANPTEVAVFPSFPLLGAVAGGLAGSPVTWGGQDLHAADKGAHTGDVSAPQLVDLGCRWALCGHSERRRDHGESDELVGSKVAAAARHGLTPLLCVGETRDERRAGATFAVLERQLRAGLAAAPPALVIAYEPVWAIGTGEVATPEIAQEAHAFVRRLVADLGSLAGRLRLLYGGSVTPENAPELAAQEDIDGFLVGGASLDPSKFLAIIAACGSPARLSEDSQS